ncbi:hypothetical protein MHTCC0001_11860 [Flavobacteriaceae bacterium MHTCC 0001]
MYYFGPKIGKYINSRVYLCFGLLCVISCVTKQPVTQQSSVVNTQQNPKIVFLNYNIKKNTSGTVSAKLLNSKHVEGKLKAPKKQIIEKGDTDDLICAQLDASSRVISATFIHNPLKKTIEYIDESKRLSASQIKLDSTQFMVRIQLFPETRYISLSQNNLDNSTTELVLTNRIDL